MMSCRAKYWIESPLFWIVSSETSFPNPGYPGNIEWIIWDTCPNLCEYLWCTSQLQITPPQGTHLYFIFKRLYLAKLVSQILFEVYDIKYHCSYCLSLHVILMISIFIFHVTHCCSLCRVFFLVWESQYFMNYLNIDQIWIVHPQTSTMHPGKQEYDLAHDACSKPKERNI